MLRTDCLYGSMLLNLLTSMQITLKERHSRFGEEDYEIGSQRMFVEPTY